MSNGPPEHIPMVPMNVGYLVLFPHSTLTLALRIAEIPNTELDLLMNSEFVMITPYLPPNQCFPTGVIGRISSSPKITQELMKIEFTGLFRANYEINTPPNTMSITLVKWKKHKEIFSKDGQEDEIMREEIKYLKILFQSALTRFSLKPKKKEAKLTLRRAQKAVTFLQPQNPTPLASTIDKVMNLLNVVAIKDAQGGILNTVPFSLQILGEERVLSRLYSLNQLLNTINIFLATPQSIPPHTANDERDQTQETIASLANTLLYDQTTVATDETIEDTLELPDDLEVQSILEMRDFLKSRIVGQERPIKSIVRAFNLAKAGLQIKDRPLLVEWWAGPSGVGKTELAYALSEFLWQKEKNALARPETVGVPFTTKQTIRPPFIKVSCGMFGGENNHGTANLIGSPVGYYGSKSSHNAQSPIFSPKNFPANRITILLFDEIEKAFLNSRDHGTGLLGILLDLLDKGKLVNNWGEEVDFRSTIVIFTSNIGSLKIVQSAKDSAYGFKTQKIGIFRSFTAVEKLNARIYKETKTEYETHIPMELRTRVNRFTVFRFLSDENYRAIIAREFSLLDPEMKRLEIKLEVADEVVEWILQEIKAEEGVRKLKDFLQKEVLESLARANNLRKLRKGKTYQACLAGNQKDAIDEDSERKIIFKII